MHYYNYGQMGYVPYMPYYPYPRMYRNNMIQQPRVQLPEEDMDGNDEMDLTNMTKLYPELCKVIYKYVVEYCNDLENDSNNFMYDEEVDKEMLGKIVEYIYNKMKAQNAIPTQKETQMQRRYYGALYHDLITSILLFEIFANRRRRNRRNRRYHPDSYGYYNNNNYYPY